MYKETIQKVKNEYNIVDYIKASGVNLESQSGNQWKGLCPFHNEKTPSFIVSEQFQSYRCFGCGVHGDIFNFAGNISGLTFSETLKMLAEEKGISIGEVGDGANNGSDVNGIRRVLADAQDFFHTNYMKLDSNHPAKQEVKKRGLDVENELYGYSPERPNELYKFLKSKGHEDKNIEDSKLVLFFEEEDREPWDFFHGRLMIALNDYLGRPISFTSRKLFVEDKMKGKYVNGKESLIFQKKSVLFGADKAKRVARQAKRIYVVEGQFDQISMFEKGIENVVATSGTAFTKEHANLLLRMVDTSGEIIFVMDGDEAGIKAAKKVFEVSSTIHSNAKAVLLDDGKDPCDYIQSGEFDTLRMKLDNPITLHDFIINSIIEDLGGISSNNRYQFVSEVAKYAKKAEDKLVIEQMLSKASVLSAISIDNVLDVYKRTENTSANSRQITPETVVEEESKVSRQEDVIHLDYENEGDICMISALALLIRMPKELLAETPPRVNKKFKLFISEVKRNYDFKLNSGKEWTCFPEEYTNVNFVEILQGKTFLDNPENNKEASIRQYRFLLNKANNIYQEEYERLKMSRVLSSVLDKTDPKDIAEALREAEKK